MKKIDVNSDSDWKLIISHHEKKCRRFGVEPQKHGLFTIAVCTNCSTILFKWKTGEDNERTS